MKISEVMTRDVRLAHEDTTIQQAARMMEEIDSGFLPVADSDHLIGMVTDRDIAIRGVGDGKSPETHVSDVMTRDVKYCFDDDDIGDVARNMSDIQVRRLPVINREKRLVGVVSIGDLAVDHAAIAGEALSGISEPTGQHSQSG